MKIALVSPYDFAYPGGVTAHIMHLEENFVRMGHEVRVMAPSSQSPETLGRPNLIAVGKPFPIPAGGSVARITLSPVLSGRVKRVLQEEKFDIVHLHEPLVPALPITVLRFSQAVNVGTFHAYHGSNLGYRYAKTILKRWFRKLDGKIAVSTPAGEFISKYFPGYYNIIPNGIDPEHFSRDTAPLEVFRDGKLNILFVGRQEKRKGLKYLLGAYRRLKERFPGIRLIVVGPEENRLVENYERLVYDTELKDVCFVGFVPYEELPRYYNAAHIFCAPSTGKESFGIVLLEAMAAARPIVASRIPGYATVVEDGKEGFLVEPSHEVALAEALARLLTDEALRQRMGALGRLKAEQYGWERVSRSVMNYYETLLAEHQQVSHPSKIGESL